MQREDDIKFMRRCIDLASSAEGLTYPNPIVGSVIVYNGLIIGEGYHLKAGAAHAEENAILSVKEKDLLGDSVLYVNLEPCSHFGRRPPCTDLIISKGIRRVVIGTLDTSDRVSGRGKEKLENAGCEVVTGVLENECRYLNRRFFTFHEKKRPFIILKWAQSSDGFIDIERSNKSERKPTWIIGKAERVLVHKWRASEQSILAGAGTIRSDNPDLTVRDWVGKNPLRLVLSGSGNLEIFQPLFRTIGTNIVFTYNEFARIPGSEIVKMDKSRDPVLQIAEYLYEKDIQSVIVEGGAQVLGYIISTGLWDEARIFYGNKNFMKGVKAPAINGKIKSVAKFSSSTLKVIVNE
ncbi:MAG: bifunctional diaminohydroxyphosphoribosylaminopyrimidine deaminase/5-amino-6-(5-phosphoribosylamino)uracil reductase RibD [Bacteroidales bacterium]